MTDEEAFAAYAEWCGITPTELVSFLDCYESRCVVGLTNPDLTARRQIDILMAGTQTTAECAGPRT